LTVALEHKDFGEWAKAGLTREELLDLIEATPPGEACPEPEGKETHRAGKGKDDQKRFAELLAKYGQAQLTMNLADPLTQKVITELCIIKEAKVLVLDNLSCLTSGVKENDADAWEMLLGWLLDLCRRRIAVVIVHHAGRSGGFMRGTTRREDPAAWIIKVEATNDPSLKGAQFETSFTKSGLRRSRNGFATGISRPNLTVRFPLAARKSVLTVRSFSSLKTAWKPPAISDRD